MPYLTCVKKNLSPITSPTYSPPTPTGRTCLICCRIGCQKTTLLLDGCHTSGLLLDVKKSSVISSRNTLSGKSICATQSAVRRHLIRGTSENGRIRLYLFTQPTKHSSREPIISMCLRIFSLKYS